MKLCVGIDSVEYLADWQQRHSHRWPEGTTRHVTRMWPRREAEVLDGGSLYWVIKGHIQARQKILRLEEEIGDDGIRRCALVLQANPVRTVAAPRRPFQGWRYLPGEDAPRDMPKDRKNDSTLPPELAQALSEIGLH
ncbi:MAG: DUF1489 family protein [Pseudorhodobacter sp.]